MAWVSGIAIVAVPASVMGATFTREGGSPTAIYMQKQPEESFTVDENGGTVIQQDVHLTEQSHLLVSFTSEWGALNVREEGLLSISLDGQSDPFEWGASGTAISRTSGTWTWMFFDVAPGHHSVEVSARVDATPPGTTVPNEGSADLNDPALTVMVIPPA